MVRKGYGAQASKWRLREPATSLAPLHPHPGGVRNNDVSDGPVISAHDVFRWGCLGKSAGRVFLALPVSGPASSSELARALSIERRAVARQLRRLEQHGLAVRLTTDTWLRCNVTLHDLDNLATRLGRAGVGASQRALHEKQREEYRLGLPMRKLRLEPQSAGPAQPYSPSHQHNPASNRAFAPPTKPHPVSTQAASCGPFGRRDATDDNEERNTRQ